VTGNDKMTRLMFSNRRDEMSEKQEKRIEHIDGFIQTGNQITAELRKTGA
jgi:hypothetical protein